MISLSRDGIEPSGRAMAAMALAVALLVTAAPPVAAQSRLVVGIDRAQVLRTDMKPATVIVGNPSIADITMQNGTLVLQGRSYGTTNIILLDGDGAEMAAFDVVVGDGAPGRVSMFKGGARSSYACLETCEVELKVGDSGAYFEAVAAQITAKSGVATGARPPAGQ